MTSSKGQGDRARRRVIRVDAPLSRVRRQGSDMLSKAPVGKEGEHAEFPHTLKGFSSRTRQLMPPGSATFCPCDVQSGLERNRSSNVGPAFFTCIVFFAVFRIGLAGLAAEEGREKGTDILSEDAQTAMELQRHVVEEREQFLQGRVVLEVSLYTGPDLPPPEEIDTLTPYSVERIEALFHGQSYRTIRSPMSGQTPGNRKLIATPEHVVFHPDDVDESGRRAAAMMGDPSHFQQDIKMYSLDPRRLGIQMGPLQFLFNASRLDSTGLDELLARPAQENLTLKKEGDGTSQQLFVSYYYSRNAINVSLRFDPNRGNTLTYGDIRTKYPLRGAMLADTLDVTPRKHPVLTSSGETIEAWYPEQVQHARFFGEKRVMYELIQVLEADFVTPVAASEFELESLNLPPQTHVIKRPDFTAMTWDGMPMGPVLPPDSVEKPAKTPNAVGKKRPMFWWIVGMNLGVLSLFLLVWYFRRPRSADNKEL